MYTSPCVPKRAPRIPGPDREKYLGGIRTRTLGGSPAIAETEAVIPTEASPAILVQCDVELLRRGIERASRRVGLSITDQESQAELIVRDSRQTFDSRSAEPVLTVDDGVIHVTATCALAPALWAAIGRLANEVFCHADV